MTTCSVDSCASPARQRGWCGKHYARWRRHGNPETTLLIREQGGIRLWSRVAITPACWLWTGRVNQDGYGVVAWDGKVVPAHHVSLLLDGQPRPSGDHEVDHLCRVRHCVRPDHLEWVLHRENVVRALPFGGFGKANRNKTACPQGHPYTEDNTAYVPTKFGSGVGRVCRTCKRERDKRRRASA